MHSSKHFVESGCVESGCVESACVEELAMVLWERRGRLIECCGITSTYTVDMADEKSREWAIERVSERDNEWCSEMVVRGIVRGCEVIPAQAVLL